MVNILRLAASLSLLASLMTNISAAAPAQNPIVVGKARFTVIAPECLRLEYSAEGAFVDRPSLFAVHRDARSPAVVRRESDGTVALDTGRMLLRYTPDGKRFHPGNLSVAIDAGDRPIVWTPASEQTENLGGTIHTLDQVKGPVDLEEGILSRDGWYLLDDSATHLFTGGWVEARPEDAGTDWYLFGYGSDYAAAFRAFTAIGGAVPMPRRAVLGSWYSRWWEYSSEDYKEIVREYEEHDFPLDVMVMDMEWHTGPWTGWSWNYELLDDPPALLEWFHEQGLTVTLNVHPADGVAPSETMYEEFMRDLGADPAAGETIPFDAADREYMEAFFRHTHLPREREGVDFWWVDWQQYPHTRSIPDLLNLTWLNHLYFERSKQGGKRGLQFSRWGQWGGHRRPIHFSGDADTGWRMLGFEVPFTSTAANEGAYFWSHDIGGHFGDRNEEPYTRWVQFAATTAAMRLHSGIIEYLDRRPWKWPEWATESMRRAFHLRAQLMPYIYSSVYQTHRTSLPLNRPMYIHRPEEADAYRAPQQYMFGESLLVAPIASQGYGPGRVASQLVWFPAGVWHNCFTSERHEGPAWRLVSADIDEFPLYVRGGTPLPMQPYSPRPTSTPLDELVVKVWPGDEGSFTLYEDDGISREYETGAFATTRLDYRREGNRVALRVGPAEGRYEGQPAARSYLFELAGMNEPESVTVDGTSASFEWDPETRTIRVRVPARAISEAVELEAAASPSDAEYFAGRARQRRLRGLAGDGAQDLAAELRDAREETLPGLLALAGFAVVENETHYPEPGVLLRLARNGDSLLSPGGIEVLYRRELFPGGKILAEERAEFSGVEGMMPFEAPAWDERVPEFLQSTRDSRTVSVKLGEKILSYTTPLEMRSGYLKEWYVSPAYEFDSDGSIDEHEYTPEAMSVEELAEIPGSDTWTLARAGDEGIVDLREVHDANYKIAYAVATFEAPEAREAVLGFRSDDGIEVWLNGEKIHSVNALRGINHSWEEVPAPLRAGTNVLLVKVSQDVAGWEFVVRGR